MRGEMLPVRVRDRTRGMDVYRGTATQAFAWYADVLGNTRPTPMRAGDKVARVLAILCGDDSRVTITRRKLAEVVGGPRWFTDDGVRLLVEAGWLKVEVVGRGRAAKTTFYLLPGPVE